MRIIGLQTEDPRTYFEMLGALREQRAEFISLSFDDPIPSNIGAIITSEREKHRVPFDKIITDPDPATAIAKARRLLSNDSSVKELVIGVDPGVKPGLAVIGDGVVTLRCLAPSPESVAPMLEDITQEYPEARVTVRIGHGDRTNRNRIFNSLWDNGYRLEIVDERNTTKRSHTPDEDAAVEIAMTPGYRPIKKQEIEPCDGEIRNIQRLSRLESSGAVTVSKDLAKRVALGEITLDDAIAFQKSSGQNGKG